MDRNQFISLECILLWLYCIYSLKGCLALAKGNTTAMNELLTLPEFNVVRP